MTEWTRKKAQELLKDNLNFFQEELEGFEDKAVAVLSAHSGYICDCTKSKRRDPMGLNPYEMAKFLSFILNDYAKAESQRAWRDWAAGILGQSADKLDGMSDDAVRALVDGFIKRIIR